MAKTKRVYWVILILLFIVGILRWRSTQKDLAERRASMHGVVPADFSMEKVKESMDRGDLAASSGKAPLVRPTASPSPGLVGSPGSVKH